MNVLVCIDISGAFDSIRWKIIIDNLIKSGISNQFLKVAETCLIDTTIILNEQFKSKTGCPQGGKISPYCSKLV